MLRTRGLYAHVRSECVHKSAVQSTILQCTKSPSKQHRPRKPQDSGPYQPASANSQVPSRATSHVAQYPSQHNSDRMRFNELPQKTRFPTTRLSEMMSATIPSQRNVLRPLTLVPQRATKGDNAHQRHTRSVQSSSCAEGGFFS